VDRIKVFGFTEQMSSIIMIDVKNTKRSSMSEELIPALVTRKIPFEFPDDLEPLWIPSNPELSAMMNGGSLVMPYLEPFLIRTMREAINQIDDEDLRAEAAGFMSQEGQHYRAHRRFNDLLKEKRYPELEDVEEQMVESYSALSKRSLATRMAYTAGFEAMTLGVTKWIIEERVKLFTGSDSRVASFVLWHMVEETEHKRVAFDIYKALYPTGFKAYWIRMIGAFHGAIDVMKFSRRAYKVMLKKEGLWSQLKSRLRLASNITRFLTYVAPFMFRAAMPWHNPRSEKDPQWVTDWIAGYTSSDHEVAPLIDTSDPIMPVPFKLEATTTAT
jgi:predicted metal-dependent hydrolase